MEKANRSSISILRYDGIQNVSSSPVDIEFDTVAFNYASISFSSPNSFRTTIDGIYTIVFECLLSDSSFQSGISISVNGTIVYGNFDDFGI